MLPNASRRTKINRSKGFVVKALVRIPSLVSAAFLDLATGPFGASADTGPLVERVRAANERFGNVAAAVAEGYAPIP